MEQEKKIILPALGALLAAIIGGVIWAGIAIKTDYEIGLVAWAIGGLAGYAVVKLSNNQTSRVHQVIAVIASLLGIVLGKFFMFSYIVNEGFEGMFDNESITLFVNNVNEFFGAMDIVFIILAVITAWRMPAKQIANSKPDNPAEQHFS